MHAVHATFAEDLGDVLAVSVARHWIDGVGMLKLLDVLHAHEALLLQHCCDVLPMHAPVLLKVCMVVVVVQLVLALHRLSIVCPLFYSHCPFCVFH